MLKPSKPDDWSDAALIRQEQIESGIDISFHDVFLPIYFEKISKSPELHIIDVGTGTGHLPLELSKVAKNIVAIEPSYGMYSVAKNVLKSTAVELVNTSSFEYKSKKKFQIAISHMCAHTIRDLDKFIASLANLITVDGEVIMTIPHPCFYHDFKNYFGDKYRYMEEQNAQIELSISLDTKRTMPQIPFFHRPLNTYSKCFNNSGLVIENIDEPWPSIDIRNKYPVPWKTSKYCIFYLRKNTNMRM